MEKMNTPKTWEQILTENGHDGRNLMEILLLTQEWCGCVTEECMKYLAERLGIRAEHIFSVVTFYSCFTMQKQGKYVISVCGGTSCHLKKGDKILRKLRAELGLPHDRDTTEDGMFTIRLTEQCLGVCGRGPVVKVNDMLCPDMTPEKVTKLLYILRETGVRDLLDDLKKCDI